MLCIQYTNHSDDHWICTKIDQTAHLFPWRFQTHSVSQLCVLSIFRLEMMRAIVGGCNKRVFLVFFHFTWGISLVRSSFRMCVTCILYRYTLHIHIHTTYTEHTSPTRTLQSIGCDNITGNSSYSAESRAVVNQTRQQGKNTKIRL